MDADGRLLQGKGQTGGDARAHQKRTGQAGPLRVGDRIDVRKLAVGVVEDLLRQRQHPADVVARSQLRHHAAIVGMHAHLGVKRVSEQSTLAVV